MEDRAAAGCGETSHPRLQRCFCCAPRLLQRRDAPQLGRGGSPCRKAVRGQGAVSSSGLSDDQSLPEDEKHAGLPLLNRWIQLILIALIVTLLTALGSHL